MQQIKRGFSFLPSRPIFRTNNTQDNKYSIPFSRNMLSILKIKTTNKVLKKKIQMAIRILMIFMADSHKDQNEQYCLDIFEASKVILCQKSFRVPGRAISMHLTCSSEE